MYVNLKVFIKDYKANGFLKSKIIEWSVFLVIWATTWLNIKGFNKLRPLKHNFNKYEPQICGKPWWR